MWLEMALLHCSLQSPSLLLNAAALIVVELCAVCCVLCSLNSMIHLIGMEQETMLYMQCVHF